MKYENVYWHDGNIKSISSTLPLSGKEKASIEVILELYRNHKSSDLQDYLVVFPGVREVFQSVDFDELTKHINPGAIDWVDQTELMIDDSKLYKYTLSLCGGRIVVFSGKAKIRRML